MNRYLKSILLTWALVLPAWAMAQVPQLARKKLTAQQLQTLKLRDDAVQKTMADFNQKLEPELKKQPQYAQMMRDLERLRTLTDPAQRKAEVAKYQATYRPVMQASLNAARLDMNKLARDLEAADPDYQFNVTPNLVMRRVTKAQPMSKGKSPSIQLNLGPAVEVVKLTEFKETHDKSGSLASSGRHNFNGSGQETSADAAVAGFCTIEAEQELDYTVPSDVKKATLVVKCKLEADASAAGIIGTGSGKADAILNIAPFTLEASAIAIAPIAWAADDEASEEVDEQIALRPGQRVNVSFLTRSNVRAFLPAHGEARAKIKQISLEVRLER
jgi:hypothetical protein